MSRGDAGFKAMLQEVEERCVYANRKLLRDLTRADGGWLAF